MRKIHLPELLKIHISNFTLYPNGLDYSYDFIKGVNLVLGGNGMGKTTFVNIVKYAIIGHYKKPFDYTRTYKDRIIEKRVSYPMDYFKNRMSDELLLTENPKVIIEFRIKDKKIVVERDLANITLLSVNIDNNVIDGKIINQLKYETLNDESKEEYLQYKYEKLIEEFAGLPFDDLIFFVNEILFFGEDHKTILWNDGASGNDVQNELFNKYFNSPDLDKQRQEAQRQAKYYDSLSRHRSEDIRAIKKVLNKVTKDKDETHVSLSEIVKLKNNIEQIDHRLEEIQKYRKENELKVSVIQNSINELSLRASDLETQKNKAETLLMSKIWETLHPQYELFTNNIKVNHICPICNKPSDSLYFKLYDESNKCFVCNTKLDTYEINSEMKGNHQKISEEYQQLNLKLQSSQREIKDVDDENLRYDKVFKELSLKKRVLQSILRNHEYQNSKTEEQNDLQAFFDEIDKLEKDKEKYQQKSKEESAKADYFSIEIENQIIQNTSKFSSLFSLFAESFLGVQCSLTFDSLVGIQQNRRFYPVIDGRIRYHEEELSESQRFFVDHSFRMSILTFFYNTPTFYIVETPDSSLDISYEKNAANVFLQFLKNPNSLIITSNLNNSSFINHIIENDAQINVSIIGLLDIAKQSIIQNTSETLLNIYDDVKVKIAKINHDRQ